MHASKFTNVVLAVQGTMLLDGFSGSIATGLIADPFMPPQLNRMLAANKRLPFASHLPLFRNFTYNYQAQHPLFRRTAGNPRLQCQLNLILQNLEAENAKHVAGELTSNSMSV
jgi:hypothetical protein